MINPPQAEIRSKRTQTLNSDGRIADFVNSASIAPVLATFLRAKTQYPILSGLQPDLYRAFMERTWSSAEEHGVIALVHPESHFTEKRAINLRAATYLRLRRHWQFINELKLYEIHNLVTYGVHVYGARREEPHFLMAASLYHPDTVERSLQHEGGTEVPGLKNRAGGWDTRPHPERVIEVDLQTLYIWASMLDEPGTSPLHARMVYPVNYASMSVLEKLSRAPRVRELNLQYSTGWHQTGGRKNGYFETGSRVNDSWDDAILQGPHFSVANPFAKQPNPTMRSNKDWAEIDLEAITTDFVPRTSYQYTNVHSQDLVDAYGTWQTTNNEKTFIMEHPRLVLSAYVGSVTGERTLQCALIPPGATHLHGVNAYSLIEGPESVETISLVGGYFSSIALDFMIKMRGDANIDKEAVLSLPVMAYGRLAVAIRKRFERLSPLPKNMLRLLRRARERREYLVEIDVLVAIELGISIEELCTIYRTQFSVLRKYESTDLYDANGRKVPAEMNRCFRKFGEENMTLADRTWVHPHSEVEYVFEFPFKGVDREQDMRAAYEKFSRMLEEHGRIIEDEG